jgi:hypothetical protein
MTMTPHDQDPEEADLKALFDSTADELAGPQLTKLKARAADIPLQRRPIWWRLWAPAFAVAMGALLVFGVQRMNRPDATNVVATTMKTARPAPAPSAVPSVEEEDELDDSDSLALVEEDESEDVYMDDGSEDLLAFGVPLGDDDLDAWLEATDELLGEGG